jgi:protein FrlC
MKTSLSSFLFFNYTLTDAIIHTAQAGFEGIDIWGGRPHAYRRDLSPDDILRLRQVLQNEGLVVASFIPAQFRYPTSLCSPLETIRADSILYIQDSIVTAAALGAPLVSICPGHTLHGQSKEDGMLRLAESLRKIAEYAAKFDLRVAIEPADAYETDLLLTCSATLDFVNQLDYPNLGVLLDNGHAFVVDEQPEQALRELENKLFHVHLDDNNGKRDQHLIPGDGTFDFPPFIRALEEIGYDGFLGIELGWDYTIDPVPVSKLAYKRVQALLSQ